MTREGLFQGGGWFRRFGEEPCELLLRSPRQTNDLGLGHRLLRRFQGGCDNEVADGASLYLGGPANDGEYFGCDARFQTSVSVRVLRHLVIFAIRR